MATHALSVTVNDRPGMLFEITQVLAASAADIRDVAILHHPESAELFFECEVPGPIDHVIERLRAVTGIRAVTSAPSMSAIYGKRIVIMGGGAQVGQVALGAITEADRHNIRGERISVDTIPLVGEQELAAAVRAVVRLPRVRLLVLAGALMGGEIATAVEEVRAAGPDGDFVEHGRQRSRRRGSRGLRSGAGRRHGGDGDCGHGEVRHPASAATTILKITMPILRMIAFVLAGVALAGSGAKNVARQRARHDTQRRRRRRGRSAEPGAGERHARGRTSC